MIEHVKDLTISVARSHVEIGSKLLAEAFTDHLMKTSIQSTKRMESIIEKHLAKVMMNILGPK